VHGVPGAPETRRPIGGAQGVPQGGAATAFARPIGGVQGAPPPAPPCPPSVRPAPPLRPVIGTQARTPGATQASAWERLCALGANLTQEQREEIWFAAVDATGTDQVDMTPEGWAQVQASIEARFGAVAAVAPDDDLAF